MRRRSPLRAALETLLLLLLLQGASGCQWLQPAQPRGPWFTLAAPAEFGRTVQMSLMLRGTFHGHPLEMPVELALSGERMTLAGFSHIGGALFSVTLTQGLVTQTRSPALPSGWQPEMFLQDVQLALLPLEQVQAHLSQADVRVTQQSGERLFFQGEQPFIRIRYSAADPLAGNIDFEQQAQDYRWTLEPLAPE